MAWCGDDQCETKRRLDEYKRKGESLCNWIGALLISLNVSTPEAGVNAVATLLREKEEAERRAWCGVCDICRGHGFWVSKEGAIILCDYCAPRTSDMICEAHPDYLWPHDECPDAGREEEGHYGS